MFRIFGILAIVLGIYVTAQVFLKTVEGTQASLEQEAVELTSDSVGQGRTGSAAAGARVRDAFAHGTAKLERALPDD